MGIQLLKSGYSDFIILEKSDDVGGTWLDNTYPGCGCDVPAMLYSFSFAIKYNWTRKYALQPELLEYFREVADRFKLRPQIRFGTFVKRARFDEAARLWRVELSDGVERTAQFLISGVGQLNRPKYPNIPGKEQFSGPIMHTARWDKNFNPQGKKVAVIGSGASAIQVIPELAKVCNQLFVVQRSPNYIAPRNDYFYSNVAQACFRWLPGLAGLHRTILFWSREWHIQLYKRGSKWNQNFRHYLVKKMRAAIPAKLRRDVIPQYPAGCKRVLLSDDYLQSLSRENVTLIPAGCEAITATGIQAAGQAYAVDAIVLATGFESNPLISPLEIIGRDGKELNAVWGTHPKTWFGVLAPGFPNFFMLYGPNTNLSHNSIIHMIESEVQLIIKCLQICRKRSAQTVEISSTAVEQFDKQLQTELGKMVWNENCGNWYTGVDGVIVNNWSGTPSRYRRLTKRINPAVLECK